MLALAFVKKSKFQIPLLKSPLPCGKGVSIEDAEIEWIDLNEYLARGAREKTLYAHAVGDSMIDCGIEDGDLLVIDRSARPENGMRAVVIINNEATVKRWREEYNRCGALSRLYLVSGNKKYPRRELTKKDEIRFFGKVKFIIKKGD